MEDNLEDGHVIRLNKYIAQCGVTNRRKAVDIIKAGQIIVNGNVETNPFYELKSTDEVVYQGKVIETKVDLAYVLLNKPKNTHTLEIDDSGKMNAIALAKKSSDTPLEPLDYLEKNDLGLLVLTNDKVLIEKFRNKTVKLKVVFHLTLDKDMTENDLQILINGIFVDDTLMKMEKVDFINGANQNEIGVNIHWNNPSLLVKIIEGIGYKVVKLDRVYFGGLTKKDLPRSWSRLLTEKEIIWLKHFS